MQAQPSLRPIPRAMPKTSPVANALMPAMNTIYKNTTYNPLTAIINPTYTA